jgi:hypothetical protein
LYKYTCNGKAQSVVNSLTWYQPKNPNRFRSSSYSTLAVRRPSTLAGCHLPPPSPWRPNPSPPPRRPPMGAGHRHPTRPVSRTSRHRLQVQRLPQVAHLLLHGRHHLRPPRTPHGSASMPWFSAGSMAPWLWTSLTSSCLPRLFRRPRRYHQHGVASRPWPLQRQQEDPKGLPHRGIPQCQARGPLRRRLPQLPEGRGRRPR